jgi:hypothetical protein
LSRVSRTRIVADGVAGAQTEAKLFSELNRMRETDGHLPRLTYH